MLCALLACVALFYAGLPAQAVAVPTQPQAVLLQMNAAAQGAQDSTPTAPASTIESLTSDLAGDQPELLLVTPLPLVATTRFDRQLRHPLHALPHPFPERPQRPPRANTRHA